MVNIMKKVVNNQSSVLISIGRGFWKEIQLQKLGFEEVSSLFLYLFKR